MSYKMVRFKISLLILLKRIKELMYTCKLDFYNLFNSDIYLIDFSLLSFFFIKFILLEVASKFDLIFDGSLPPCG